MLSTKNIEDILSFVKCSPDSFNKTSQTIVFGDDFAKEGCYIFQINNDILKYFNTNNNSQPVSFSIKGQSNDIAVLCTNDKSYEIREAETSNTLLILPNLELNHNSKENDPFINQVITVSKTCNKFYEVHLRKSKIGQVFKILQRSILYHHIDDKTNANEEIYTFDKLLQIVVMSEEELKNALCELKVYNVYGYLRLLYIDYNCDIIRKIIDCSFENDYSIFNVSQNNVQFMLADLFPKEILDQTLNYYFEKIMDKNGDSFWKINIIEVARCFAEFILNKSDEMKLDEFLVKWNEMLPEDLSGDTNYLHGLVIINETSQPSSVKLVKSVTLSDEPGERFKELFIQKSHWQLEYLEGYIRDLVPVGMSASQLIMRYCRCTNNAKIKTFSKR